MENVKIKGIVVRSAPLGDNDKMLTVLTGEAGAISVCARGVKSLKNKNAQGVMPLCYSEYVLKRKGEIYSLVSADVIECFYPLREDLTLLSYGVYFAHLAEFCTVAGNCCEDEVRLLLNTLYMLSKNAERRDVLKCVFELKICEYAGIAPYMESCACGEKPEYFDIQNGEGECGIHKGETARKMSEEARRVCCYVQNSPLKEALTFDAPAGTAREVSALIEEFMIYQLGRLPKSLDYIKKIL